MPRERSSRARDYHRPLYLALFADWALQLAVLVLIVFGPPGDWLWEATGGPWWARTFELTVLVLVVSAVVRLPLSAWRGWVWERRWGFSTQSFGAWLGDVAKGLSLGAVLVGLGLTALVWSARSWPTWWPVPAALGAALLALLLEPARAAALRAALQPLRAARGRGARARDCAGSRSGPACRCGRCSSPTRAGGRRSTTRTCRGSARRGGVVIYDTLLADVAGAGAARSSSPTSSATAATATSRSGTVLAMLGAAAAVVALRVVFAWDGLVEAAGSDGPGDPRIVPLVLLALFVLEIGALPFETWLSRSWERVADRFAIELTRDAETMQRMHRRLALANLSDLDPPRARLPAPVHAPDAAGAHRGSQNGDVSHSHSHTSARRPLAIALGLILGLMVGEVVAGVVAGSLALLADAGHMLTDAAALGLRALRRRRWPARPAARALDLRLPPPRDPRRAGQRRHARSSSRLDRLRRPCAGSSTRPRCAAAIVLVVALAGLAVNVVAAALLLARASRESLNVRGAFLHVADRPRRLRGHGGRRAVVLATGWDRFDPIASLVVAALMLLVELVAAARVDADLPRGRAGEIDPEEVGRAMRRRAATSSRCTTCTSGRSTSGFPALSAHVLVDPGADCHALRRRARAMLRERFDLDAHDAAGRARARARRVESQLADRTPLESDALWPASRGRPRSSPAPRAGSAPRPRARSPTRARASPAARAASTGSRPRSRSSSTSPTRRAASASSTRGRELGGLDILVNAAGLALGRDPFDGVDRGGRARPCSRRTCNGARSG